MDKNEIIELIMRTMMEESEAIHHAASAARDGATHEESAAEDRYDTRALELSYLAGAQASRAEWLRNVASFFRNWRPGAFQEGDYIRPGCLIEVESEHGRRWLLLAPVGGGERVTYQDHEVSVVTPESPIGQELIGLEPGDDFELTLDGHTLDHEVLTVL
ncbi:MAG: GreA/GreB family elongation factor [Myxococcales bacterium]|nr:GreA/GreB family elongation factor [Myxococcales bacterium]